jgi:4'-phosphopantetheinyl transferase
MGRNSGGRGEWNISSSSREDVFLFGLARGARIGVDVESVHPLEPPAIALHPAERQRLAGLPDMLRVDAFYGLWTVKEAYLKALGVGLRREPSDIRVIAQDGGLEIADRGRPVALAACRNWRESVAGKTAICSALTLMKSEPPKPVSPPGTPPSP